MAKVNWGRGAQSLGSSMMGYAQMRMDQNQQEKARQQAVADQMMLERYRASLRPEEQAPVMMDLTIPEGMGPMGGQPIPVEQSKFPLEYSRLYGGTLKDQPQYIPQINPLGEAAGPTIGGAPIGPVYADPIQERLAVAQGFGPLTVERAQSIALDVAKQMDNRAYQTATAAASPQAETVPFEILVGPNKGESYNVPEKNVPGLVFQQERLMAEPTQADKSMTEGQRIRDAQNFADRAVPRYYQSGDTAYPVPGGSITYDESAAIGDSDAARLNAMIAASVRGAGADADQTAVANRTIDSFRLSDPAALLPEKLGLLGGENLRIDDMGTPDTSDDEIVEDRLLRDRRIKISEVASKIDELRAGGERLTARAIEQILESKGLTWADYQGASMEERTMGGGEDGGVFKPEQVY